MNDSAKISGGGLPTGLAQLGLPDRPAGALDALLGGLIERMTGHWSVKDAASGRYIGVSDGLAALLNRPAQDVLGRSDAELVDATLATALRAAEQTALAQADPLTSEHRFEWNGTRHEFSVMRLAVDGEGGTRWLVAIMSGHDRKGRWRVGRHLKVINVMGGSSLDLNDAELADDVVEMTVVAVLGGADIRVPEGLNVELTDFAILGGNDSDLGVERPDPGGPTLRLRVISILGGTDVKRGRKLTRAERKAKKHLGHSS